MPVYLLPNSDLILLVVFDQTRGESHELTAEVTEHPVEAGSNIVDHIRPNPISLGLELYITNTPIEDLGRGSIQQINANGFRGQALKFPEPFDRIKETHESLTTLWMNGISMSVVTSVRTYDDMAFTRVSLPRNEPGGATFSLDLKQIRTVTTASVKAPKPAEKRGAPKQAKGSQATKAPENPAKMKSGLAKLIDAGASRVPGQ